MESMAYIGEVKTIRTIEGADRIVSASIVCGRGGRWNVVVPKGVEVGQRMTVFLPDALVPQVPELAFMEKNKWRVKMSRFKGAPSEALAIPEFVNGHSIGEDVTEALGVKKFEKTLPLSISGEALGAFPIHLIHKTDEMRYQAVPEMVDMVRGHQVIATMKIDGSSVTVINDNGNIRVCSRNLELRETPGNALWKVVRENHFHELLPTHTAIQFEIAGPGIQGNPLKLENFRPYIFNVYDMQNRRYYGHAEMRGMVWDKFYPPVVYSGIFNFTDELLQALADSVKYGDKPGEGIVIRPLDEMETPAGDRVSFKVINLLYKES